jgi:hypothetical protein
MLLNIFFVRYRISFFKKYVHKLMNLIILQLFFLCCKINYCASKYGCKRNRVVLIFVLRNWKFKIFM